MADRKISDLTALTTPAAGDYLPIVDISESAAASKNKRITIEELLRGAPDGTAAAPGIAFESDPNTGIYSPGADQVAISTNAVERVEFGTSGVVFNDGGENYDFRIEGDTNANLFFVDASAEAVGIGTTSPTSSLQVGNGTGLQQIYVSSAGSDLLLGPSGGNAFGFSSDTASLVTVPSKSVPLVLGTIPAQPVVFGTGNFERARIDSSGRLLVGTSSSSGNNYLQIQGDAGGATGTGGISLRRNVAPSDMGEGAFEGIIDFGPNDGGVGARIAAIADAQQGTDDYPSRLVFSVTADGAASPTEALRISNDRSITVSDGGNVVLGTTTGTKIGTATTQKLGFYNATPVVQPAAVADATTAIDVITQLNDLLAKLRTLGIIAT
jgi:hypothetical protein